MICDDVIEAIDMTPNSEEVISECCSMCFAHTVKTCLIPPFKTFSRFRHDSRIILFSSTEKESHHEIFLFFFLRILDQGYVCVRSINLNFSRVVFFLTFENLEDYYQL